MLVGAIAGVDDRGVHDQRDGRRRSVFLVPDHERVGPHRVQRPRRILQGLALFHRAVLDRKRNGLRAQSVDGGRERHRRARGAFVEDVEDDPPGQRSAGPAVPVGQEMPGRALKQRGDLPDGEEQLRIFNGMAGQDIDLRAYRLRDFR